jgi:hypothetical protein
MPQLLEQDVPNSLRDEVYSLWESGKLSDSDIKTDKDVRRTFIDLSKRSLFFFSKAVLGYGKLTKQSHLYVCQRTQDLTSKRQLVLQPRGTFKSTIRTVSFPAHRIINDPDVRILLASQTAAKAEGFLSEIEQHFDGSNTIMTWLFPELIRPGDKWNPWNRLQMTSPGRTIISGTPSIMTMGVGGRIEGHHFDIIVLDDLIGEKALDSEKEMLDAIIWHDGVDSLFIEPSKGIERGSGTRWSLNDLYGVIEKSSDYETITIPAEDPITGELMFPDLLNAQTLRSIRERNFALYMSQYLNNPKNPEVLEFRTEWLQPYTLQQINGEPCCVIPGLDPYPVSEMDVVLAIDPAGSGDVTQNLAESAKKGRMRKCNNAVEIWAAAGDGKRFLLDMWAGRASGENPELQVARKVLEFFVKWDGYIRCGYLESYGAQGALITVFNMLCRERGLSYPLKALPKGDQRAKAVRTRSVLGPLGQNHQLYVRPGHTAFIYEFGVFPQSNENDTLDAATWALSQLRQPSNSMESSRDEEETHHNLVRRLRSVGITGY